MEILLLPLCEADVEEFKREMQKAFKMGAVAESDVTKVRRV